jgi:hypothetical protein
MTVSEKAMGPLDQFHGNAPIGPAEIEIFETEAGFRLPTEYRMFLQNHNGGEGFIGSGAYVILWRLEELLKMNVAYEVEEYVPGFFFFGSDGGGEAFAFDRTKEMAIVSMPFVGMEPDLATPIALTFGDFLKALAKV